MIYARDFAVKVDYDSDGLLVSVTHHQTGIQSAARPRNGESVRRMEEKLVEEVQRKIYNKDDFQLDHYLYEENGRLHTMRVLTHLPTGRSRRVVDSFQECFDELVKELWNEGIRPE